MMQAVTKETCNIISLNPKVLINRDSHPFNLLEVLPFPIRVVYCGVGVTGGKSSFLCFWFVVWLCNILQLISAM